jgi:predicted nucleic acid-binding Zn ribbon protein
LERLSDAVRRELSRFGPQAGLAEVVARWPSAVGDGIARNAWPARIARDGTLHVNTSDSVWAFELAQRAREIAQRADVSAVRFAPGPLPGAEPAVTRPAVPRPSEEQVREAVAIAASMDDENLRKTVEKAVGLCLARGRSDHCA